MLGNNNWNVGGQRGNTVSQCACSKFTSFNVWVTL